MVERKYATIDLCDLRTIRVVCPKCDTTIEVELIRLVEVANYPECPGCSHRFYLEDATDLKVAVKHLIESVDTLKQMDELVRFELVVSSKTDTDLAT